MDPQLYDQFNFNKAGKNIQWKKDTLFNKWCQENWTATLQKNETRPLSCTIHKDQLKLDEGPECETGHQQRGESKKKQEKAGKAEKNLSDLCCSNFLLDTSPKTKELKAKMNY